MKNRKLLLLPFLALILAGCSRNSSSSTPPDSSQPPVTSDPSESLPSVPSETSELPPVIETISIEEARDLPDKDKAAVEGTITSIYEMASEKMGMTLQEGAFAITLTFVMPEDAAKHEVGDHIIASGEISAFNGLVQLQNAKLTKSDKTPEVIVPHVLTSWNPTAMEGMDGRIVRAEGLKYLPPFKENSTGNVEFPVKFSDSDTVFPIYLSAYIKAEEKTLIKAKFNDLGSADTITFEGPLGWYLIPQLNPVRSSTLTVVEGTPVGPVDPVSISFTPSSVTLDIGDTHTATPIIAPSDATYEKINYVSENPAVATVNAEGAAAEITAVAEGTTAIVATVGNLSARFTVTVNRSTEGVETLYKLDLTNAAAMVESDQTGDNYSYNNDYIVKITDGTTALQWKAHGINPNNWAVPGIRFGGKDTNTKLAANITSGLPMDAALAAELSATFVQSMDKIVGEVNEVVVEVIDVWSSGIELDKIYLQASADAAFTTPIDLGAKSYGKGTFVFRMETALTDHYFRVIFGMKNLTGSNTAIIVSYVDFNNNSEPYVPVDNTVTALDFSASDLSLEVGQTKPTTLVITPLDGDITGLTYESDDAEVATVAADGKVTGVAVGTATISAKLRELKAEIEVTVSAPIVGPVSIEAARSKVGEEVTVVGTVTGLYGMASSKFGATIQQGDYALSLAFMTAEQYALLEVGDKVEVKGKIANYNGLIQLSNLTSLEVLAEAGEVIVPHVLTSWDPTALVGKDARIVRAEGLTKVSGTVTSANSDIKVKFAEGPTFSLYMSTYIAAAEKEALATKINGMGAFDTITFQGPIGWYNNPQLNPITASTVTIVEGAVVPATAIEFTPDEVSVEAGKTVQSSLAVTPLNGDLTGLEYESDDELIATVDAAGKVTGVAAGSATITATLGSLTAELEVTVTEPVVHAVTPVVISEIYGGGGNSGATLKSDFIELYNNTDSDIDLTGWGIWYASGTGAFKAAGTESYETVTVLSGTIKAKSYFLVKAATGSGGTVDLPTPDVVGALGLGASNFKIALTSSTDVADTALGSANLVDYVGAGTAGLFEGSAAAPAPSATKSISRKLVDGIYVDTNDNGADFVTTDPNPINSAGQTL